jgi:hypothetical protein
MANIETEILQIIDEALFLPFTNSPIKKPIETDTNQIFITVQNPALPISPSDYQDGWSPGKTDDNPIATKLFSERVDAIPALEPMHHLNGQTISQLYQQILGATVKFSGVEEVPQAYRDAENILYKRIAINNAQTGNPTNTQTKDSDRYRRYKEGKANYLNALAVYQSQYISYIKTPEGKKMWPLVSAGFHAPVDVAWNQYRAAEATRIEEALDTIDRMANRLVSTVFQDANQHYSSYQKFDPMATTQSFAPSYPMPSNWVDETEGWNELKFSFKQKNSSNQRSPQVDELLEVGATHLKIKFQFKVVRIERPWLRFDLVSLPNWAVDAVEPGAYSNGTKILQETSLFPLLPQAFIVVQHLEATGNWSETDITRIESALSSTETAKFARFLLNGSYTSNGKSVPYKAKFDNNILTFPELHIVGWINRIVPFSPPKNDAAKLRKS